MARKPTGQLYENRSRQTGKVTSYGVRFRYGGRRRYESLDIPASATRKEAETALAHFMADVQRGLWTPPEDRAPEPEPRRVPTLAEFVNDTWFPGREADGLSEKGREDVLWRLAHLIGKTGKLHLGPLPLDRIGVEDVDRYRRAKVKEGALGASSINKTIATLAAVIEVAVEYGYAERNVAKGKRRRLKAPRPRRVTLTRAEHVAALLDAAGALDAAGRDAPYRRALLAVLVFAGPRIGEALALRRRDVDLPGQRLTINGTKTEAARRVVEIAPALHDVLAAYLAGRDLRPDDLLFGTARVPGRFEGGARRSPSNVRTRVLAPAVETANEKLRKRGAEPLPDGLTPHGLRRTFVSILCARRVDLPVAMRQAGHAGPQMTLGIYAQAWDWSEEERERLRALWNGEPLAPVEAAPALATGSGEGNSAVTAIAEAGTLEADSAA